MGEAAYITSVSAGAPKLQYVTPAGIKRIREKIPDRFLHAKILADIFRINALYMIRFTGSGHLGSTFSCTDVMTWLWTEEMQNPNEKDADPSDIFFSSKGHDVPALYALLIGLEKLPFEMIHKLRRLGGLPGHPDIHTSYIATNTGSLGMGISKARGMATAKRLQGKSGRFYVLTGDGELQEGQIWESLQPTANNKFSEITVIVDHNKIQSDTFIKDTSDLGNLEEKFRAFGWEVARCNGHDFYEIAKAISWARSVKDKPQVIIADTVKGKGVSFMEKMGEDGLYKFHSGAPSQEHYEAALKELTGRVNGYLKEAGLSGLQFASVEVPARIAPQNPQKLVAAYGDELVKIARERKDIVAMDADLVLDTGLLSFKKEFPDRYIQCGIAEQDMVSLAGGLAIQGILPVVHSFECFLSTRANEHFYNNATEKTKIIYVGSLAGLLPGMPGHSHQSVRGISCLGAIPGLLLIEPCNEAEARLAIRWAVEQNSASSYLRLISIPCKIPYELPAGYTLEKGRGVFLAKGKDAALITYGPVMLSEAVKAANILTEKAISLAVINLPWLNIVEGKWLTEAVKGFKTILTLDDHYVSHGQGELIAATLAREGSGHPKIVSLGVEEIPACGWNDEVLTYHKLDAASLAKTTAASLL